MSASRLFVHHPYLVSTRLVLSRVNVAMDTSMMLQRRSALVIKTNTVMILRFRTVYCLFIDIARMLVIN